MRRRSGGGAVLIGPGEQFWLDVFVPSTDELSEPDVGKSFHWLGDAFADSLVAVLGTSASLGAISVHRGTALKTPWSRTLCFAGLGAGEVTVAGRKVVGMSARRERSGAWIHAMALLSNRGQDLAEFLAGSPGHRDEARAALSNAGLPDAEHLVGPLTEEVLSRLP